MGCTSGAPKPSDQENALAQEQTDMIKQQNALSEAMLTSQGYTKVTNADGSVSYQISPEAQSQLDLNKQVQEVSSQKELDALNGNIEVDPSVLLDIDRGREQLKSQLTAQMGPGAEGSDSWNRAMAAYDAQSSALKYNIKHAQMTTSDALASNASQRQGTTNQYLANMARGGVSDASNLLGYYQGNRQIQMQGTAATGQAIGSGMSGAVQAGMIGASLLWPSAAPAAAAVAPAVLAA